MITCHQYLHLFLRTKTFKTQMQ